MTGSARVYSSFGWMDVRVSVQHVRLIFLPQADGSAIKKGWKHPTIRGERECNKFVPVLGGDGTRIAPSGDISDQLPGGIC